ncbi:precorrin-6y C5,15-methyltransferase (decarboxylating) subunit CbiE [Tomitella biformata]|uniref:precorrin-6y C5,15-methyltransferase (decarboxylating) subunit CbiE n=1 Tax=Tomitella biformata TaxID=630403 RepID=UPI00046567FE|nr:precorrin-6y C5,15-methyltransferase (decarboxylating) subunit CbiE [Tomitella biformata]
MNPVITVVGIGADGWEGLAPRSRDVVLAAEVLLGGARHLAMLPSVAAVVEPWPSPLRPNLDALLGRHLDRRVVVLASGDPLVSGIGTTLIELLGPDAVEVLPAVSSVALARARMRWSAESTDVVTVVGRDVDAARRYFGAGRRLIVLSSDRTTPAELARLLAVDGFGASRLTVLSNLGVGDESRIEGTALAWDDTPVPNLNIVCVDCRADTPTRPGYSTSPGLPDDAYANDGQLTKHLIRAAALAALAPMPGQLLWDVGGGAGSIGIEWMRTDPRCQAIAVERDPARAARITANARRLGVPGLQVVTGSAPAALDELALPDAVFLGGGVAQEGNLAACWNAMLPGGRLVAHAVTLEGEMALISQWQRRGGELSRISLEQAAPLGSLSGWTPRRPVTQWAVTIPFTDTELTNDGVFL